MRITTPEGGYNEWILPMSMLGGEGAEYRRELLSRGLEIPSGRATNEALHQYISESKPNKIYLTIEKVGWTHDAFTLPEKSYGNLSENSFRFSNKGILDIHSFKQQGSLSEWKEVIARLCKDNLLLIFALVTAFASPLLKLLGEESGGFHFYGFSSAGKTTMLRIVASVWGGGEPGPIKQWRATSTGLEGLAEGHSDAVLCLDEIGQDSSKDIGDIIYMLANETGKTRDRKNESSRDPLRWKLLCLSTGEVRIMDKVKEGGSSYYAGQSVRIIEVTAVDNTSIRIFETPNSFNSPKELAESLKS